MTPEVFAEWMRRQGHIVRKTESTYWHSQGPRVYQAFPYHWVITPSGEELATFLKTEKAIALRYSTPLGMQQGKVSYHAIYEQPVYGFENLGKWARKNVRRGLRKCTVQPISFQQLAEDGFALQLDTLDRQARKVTLSHKVWRTRCLSAANLPGFEAWGALVNGRLAASVITFQMGDCGYMLYQQCHRDYLRHHVNNALSFVVTQSLMQRPDITRILYGLHSLDAPPSVDEFKFRMGYTAKPVRQRVVFHPAVQPLLGNAASHGILKGLLRLRPGDALLSKAEGMVRFYRQGRLPLDEQDWPPPLA